MISLSHSRTRVYNMLSNDEGRNDSKIKIFSISFHLLLLLLFTFFSTLTAFLYSLFTSINLLFIFFLTVGKKTFLLRVSLAHSHSFPAQIQIDVYWSLFTLCTRWMELSRRVLEVFFTSSFSGQMGETLINFTYIRCIWVYNGESTTGVNFFSHNFKSLARQHTTTTQLNFTILFIIAPIHSRLWCC